MARVRRGPGTDAQECNEAVGVDLAEQPERATIDRSKFQHTDAALLVDAFAADDHDPLRPLLDAPSERRLAAIRAQQADAHVLTDTGVRRTHTSGQRRDQPGEPPPDRRSVAIHHGILPESETAD